MITEWLQYYYINETDLMCYAIALVMGLLGWLVSATVAWLEIKCSFKDAWCRRYD